MSAKKALDYLEENDLTQKEHLRLLGILSKNLNVFPLDNVLKATHDGGVLANGKKLNMDEVIKFRIGISNLRDNWAFQLLGDQILYESIKWGVHNGDTTEKMMFSKSAIYFITKFREYIQAYDVKQ